MLLFKVKFKGVEKMNTVEPIRDINIVLDIADYLKSRNERDYVLFMFGIYTGLRISDILKFRIRDIRNKDYICIKEQKTGKDKRFLLQKDLKDILKAYIKDKKDYEYLFKSRQGYNKPITRETAYSILKVVANEFNIENIGTHTMRKTFGYFLYKQTKDLVAIKEILNHSDISETRRYIGLTQDNKDSMVQNLSFKRK